MKKVLNKIKKNKTLSFLIIIAIISFILGVLLIAFLDKENKNIILTSLNNLLTTISDNKQNNLNTLYRSIGNNLLIDILIWLLGISIIGIPLILIIFSFKSFLLGFTLTSFIYNFKFKGIILGLVYITPHLINILTLFILSYYSVKFSLMLFNYLFRKIEYNKNIIVKRYLKFLIICSMLFLVSSIIEAYLIPIILKIIL